MTGDTFKIGISCRECTQMNANTRLLHFPETFFNLRLFACIRGQIDRGWNTVPGGWA